MQTNFRKAIGAAAAMLVPALASAHPGHAAGDVTAQVSQPFAGADHFVAFVALSALLLTVLKLVRKARATDIRR